MNTKIGNTAIKELNWMQNQIFDVNRFFLDYYFLEGREHGPKYSGDKNTTYVEYSWCGLSLDRSENGNFYIVFDDNKKYRVSEIKENSYILEHLQSGKIFEVTKELFKAFVMINTNAIQIDRKVDAQNGLGIKFLNKISSDLFIRKIFNSPEKIYLYLKGTDSVLKRLKFEIQSRIPNLYFENVTAFEDIVSQIEGERFTNRKNFVENQISWPFVCGDNDYILSFTNTKSDKVFSIETKNGEFIGSFEEKDLKNTKTNLSSFFENKNENNSTVGLN